ncbi:phage virion morphogenesis protein [Salinicola sp. LHM]|uniref:phage virion morphogenesis protein n=1 Tax=Salinicola sp. LHM TaxID=3065298 RepID=UPI002ACE276A|nr:phage virion morphogenesis protein [Salinicola sp. LHM]WQH33373.1 phage virion morphogenesis protein [Salinicola sp. LHM]
MSDDALAQLDDWVEPLLAKLESAERKKLAREIGIALRKRQQQRIRLQKNPDGTPYAKRVGKKKRRRARKRLRFIYEKPGHEAEEREIVNWFSTPETYFGFDQRHAGSLRTFKKRRVVRVLEIDLTPVADPREKAGKRNSSEAMFAKLRTARYLKMKATADRVSIGYEGRIAHIARIHQEGKRAPVNSHLEYDYPERQLLGTTPDDIELVHDILIRHLGGNLQG